jgi:ABC-type oligopeptide transport system substrate-binding subunit/class 3 adenylate cyclase
MARSASGRILAAVLFTDIVNSTAIAEELGDRRWKTLVDRHNAIMRRELKRFGGRELDTSGDGFFASFREPTRAIACACAAADAVRELGIEIRSGIHFGECEPIGRKLGGISVVVGARIMALGGAGDVLVSSTAAELARGAGFRVEDRGTHVLKGVEEEWRVAAVVSVDGHSRAPTLGPAEAAAQRATIEPGGGRTRGRTRVVVALLVALALVAALFQIVARGGKDAATGFPSGPVIIDAKTGKLLAAIPPSSPAYRAGGATYGNGNFWLGADLTVAVDPRTGKLVTKFPVPVEDGGQSVVDGDTLWVAAFSEGIVKIDTRTGKVLDRWDVDEIVGGEPGGGHSAQSLTVGAGSVWVDREVGSGQVVRLDASTGRVQHVFQDLGGGFVNLTYGDGVIWSAGLGGMNRIDPKTNSVTHVDLPEVWNVAAGGGFGWASDDRKGVVYQVDRGGHVVKEYDTGPGANALAFSDGTLWVSNSDVGTVVGIDVVTKHVTTTYRFGHPTGALAAGPGVLLVVLAPGKSFEDRIDQLTGKVARLFVDGQFHPADPAVATSRGAYQVEYATCANLLNYPDEPASDGWRLQPEVATAMPVVSPDGRTYTFTIRSGFRFSPPSGQTVTAETFVFSIERTLSAKVDDAPGLQFLGDIVGEEAFLRGRARHISGLRAVGDDQLEIMLLEPSATFLERLSLPFFCPVPTDTPPASDTFGSVERDLGSGDGPWAVPSDGPYYIADYFEDEYSILRPNPNYGGERPQALDAIALREGVDASTATGRVQGGGWDGVIAWDPVVGPASTLATRWGPGSAAAANGDQRYYPAFWLSLDALAFNAGKPPFSDPSVRRAASLVLDRAALADPFDEAPISQLLPPAQPGYRVSEPVPTPDLAQAKALMHGRRFAARMASYAGCDVCTQWAEVVKANLARIGIMVRVTETDDALGLANAQPRHFDLLNSFSTLDYPDPVTFLSDLLVDAEPVAWLPHGVREALTRLDTLTGGARVSAASDFAHRLVTQDVPAVGFGVLVTGQYLSPRIGCTATPPFGYGVDLAALCIAPAAG